MGVRGEIFSNKVMLPNRTYFFNVKENRMGDLYLNVVESKNRDNGGFDRQSVILFADDLQEFLKGFDESLKVMEKAMREKRHSGGRAAKREEGREDKNRSSVRDSDRSERSRSPAGERSSRSYGGDRPERNRPPAGERSVRSRSGDRSERSRPSAGERSARSYDGDRPERNRPPAGERSVRSRSGDRSERSRDSTRKGERGSDRKPDRSKRVVVRKRD